MGLLYGWKVLQDGVTLTGVVDAFNGTPSSDGDWCLLVRPDASSASLLKNPEAPHPNSSGCVECEIEPPDNLKGKDAEDDATVLSFLNPMLHRHVTIQGTWAVDLQHRWDDATSPCIFSACDDGKTEIHPIASILHERDRPDPYTRRFDFFVFSDDSENFPTSVPFSKQNRTGTFAIPAVEGATWSVSQEIDMSRSKQFGVSHTATGWTFTGHVESGTPGEGKGFYYGLLDLHLPAPPPPPTMRLTVQHPTPVPWGKPMQVTVHAYDSKTGAEIRGADVTVGTGAGAWTHVGTTPATFETTLKAPEEAAAPHIRALVPIHGPVPHPPRRVLLSYYVQVGMTGYKAARELLAQEWVQIGAL